MRGFKEGHSWLGLKMVFANSGGGLEASRRFSWLGLKIVFAN